MENQPALPTYKTIAEVLEKKNGSGTRLVGWTFARAALIAPGFLVIGLPWKRVLIGSMISSSLISIFTYIRIFNASYEKAKEISDYTLSGNTYKYVRGNSKRRRRR